MSTTSASVRPPGPRRRAPDRVWIGAYRVERSKLAAQLRQAGVGEHGQDHEHGYLGSEDLLKIGGVSETVVAQGSPRHSGFGVIGNAPILV